MDRLIQVPIWVIFWLIFIGAIAGTFISPWIDSMLERRLKKGNDDDSHIEKI